MISVEEIVPKLIEILNDEYSHVLINNSRDPEPDDKVLDFFNIDSLDLIEIEMLVEELLNLELDSSVNSEVSDQDTFTDLARALHERIL